MKYFSFLTVLFCVFFNYPVQAQNEEYILPTLVNVKKYKDLQFKEEKSYPGISTSYIVGTTEKDTLRYPVTGIGFDLIPFKIMVISPDPSQSIEVILVKNNWKDIAKTGTTSDGLFVHEFRTAEQFGIMIAGAKPGIPFRLGVYKGPVIKRTSPLFIPAANFRSGKTNDVEMENGSSEKVMSNNEASSGSNSLVWVIGIAALIIIGLLIYIIINKKRKANTSLLLFILTGSYILLSSLGTPAGRAAFIEGMGGMNETLSKAFNQGGDLADFAGKVGEVARGGADFKNLTEYDDVFEPDMDPKGQPSLPSSCLSASPSSSPSSNPGNSRPGKSSENPYDELNDRDNKYDKKPPNTSGTDPVMGDVYQSDASRQRTLVQPKYDKNGNLISTGDYPDAPTKVGIDPVTGEPILPVFAGRNIITRAPKYDKNGRLIDAGDDANAPTRVPVDPETGELLMTDHTPRYSSSGEKPDELNSKKSTAPGEGSNNRSNARRSNSQDEKKNNSEGCQCLKEAYEKLEETRYKFEKLSVILNSTSKFTTSSLSFGDNVSGIHAVSGLAWQAERKKIVKSYEEFQKAYDKRYDQLVDEMYDNLMKVDKCELKLGFENWYSIAGFMYYEFAKARYHRNGK